MPAGRIMKSTALAALAAGAFLFLAAADLALRSHSALLEAQKQEKWRETPSLKTGYYDSVLREKLAGLDRTNEKISPESLSRKKDLLEAERDFRISESSAKMAYIWYKTAAEDFSFPLNLWAAKAKARLPAALAAWRAELAAKNIKAEPWMTQ